jgi:hypothetical protein
MWLTTVAAVQINDKLDHIQAEERSGLKSRNYVMIREYRVVQNRSETRDISMPRFD